MCVALASAAARRHSTATPAAADDTKVAPKIGNAFTAAKFLFFKAAQVNTRERRNVVPWRACGRRLGQIKKILVMSCSKSERQVSQSLQMNG